MAEIPNKINHGEGHELHWQAYHQMSFPDMVAAGMISGAEPISHGCTVRSLAAATGYVRWSMDQEVDTGFLTPASTVYLVSTDAGDTGVCRVHGVDANGDFTITDTTMTGTTPVAIAGTWNHIQKVIYTAAADNVGSIYCSTKSTAGVPGASDDVQALIEPTFNYAVNPLGKNLRTFEVDITDGFLQFDLDVPMFLREGDKLRIVIGSLTGTVGGASFGFNGYILKNEGTIRRGVYSP
jgi:hypothetical protein